MTQEEKQLLLQDLCARLPYGVKVHTWYNKPMNVKCVGVDIYTNTVNLDIPNDDDAKVYIENVKPYLRPMESMTEEEKKGERKLWNIVTTTRNDLHYLYTDFLVSHHLDYRGLIPMGLALPATEDMYN